MLAKVLRVDSSGMTPALFLSRFSSFHFFSTYLFAADHVYQVLALHCENLGLWELAVDVIRIFSTDSLHFVRFLLFFSFFLSSLWFVFVFFFF